MNSEFLLSIVIPCFNSEKQMATAIRSAIEGGPEVEVLVVDNGSNDNTSSVANEYASRYPEQVRYIFTEHGGPGEAVMAGLNAAGGRYFKVLGSDDRLLRDGLEQVLELLRSWVRYKSCYDMLVCNYIYDKASSSRNIRMHYHKVLPEGQAFSWNDVGGFASGRLIAMPAVIYRRQVLLDSGLQLPANNYFGDDIYMYQPLSNVKSMYYLNADVHHYYVGREDPRLNDRAMIRRIDDQIAVIRQMHGFFSLEDVEPRRLREYMIEYLRSMYLGTSALLIMSGTEDHLAAKEQLWSDLRSTDPFLFRKIRGNALTGMLASRHRALHRPFRLAWRRARKRIL